MTMDIKYVKKLCESIGIVKKFRKNYEFFGNIELEIETPRKTLINIISDRGIFSCCINKKHSKKWMPIERIINDDKNITFCTLEDAIDFLKNILIV